MSVEERDGFDDLEFVRAEPAMIQASVIGVFDGRCAVAYHGSAGRCTEDSEYKTTIDWNGETEYVALCPKHAGRDGR